VRSMLTDPQPPCHPGMMHSCCCPQCLVPAVLDSFAVRQLSCKGLCGPYVNSSSSSRTRRSCSRDSVTVVAPSAFSEVAECSNSVQAKLGAGHCSTIRRHWSGCRHLCRDARAAGPLLHVLHCRGPLPETPEGGPLGNTKAATCRLQLLKHADAHQAGLCDTACAITWLIQSVQGVQQLRVQGNQLPLDATNGAGSDPVLVPVDKVHVEGTGVVHQVGLRDVEMCTALCMKVTCTGEAHPLLNSSTRAMW
jgi:hypothetical protein